MDRRREGGFLTVQLTLASGLCVVLVVLVTQLLVFSYARGVVRAALDEGVRAGARAGPDAVARCEAAVGQGLADLLGGSLGRHVTFRGCAAGPGTVDAAAAADLPSWTPLTPGWRFEVAATAVREAGP